jgi:pimeloyl-ACP methyl ester carboxylesterase
VSGVEVHLRRAGAAGAPVLLLHGIGGSSASFGAQLGALAPSYRALAWDAPGYGASPDPTRPPGMSGYAGSAAAVLEQHGAGHLVGVSWGGVIATRLAAQRPDLVRSLTLADSSRGAGRTPEGAAQMVARADQLAELGAGAFARSRGPRLPAPGAPASLVDAVVATMAAVRLPGYRYAAQSMAETDHSALLARIAVPTLVLVGEQDRVTGVAESRRLAEGIAGARLCVLPGAGHAANQECPQEFNHLLVGFLEQVEVTTATGGAR